MLFLLRAWVRPVTSVRQFQGPQFVLTDGAGEDVLTVTGLQKAEGDVDESFVALAALPLKGVKQSHGRQVLSWEFDRRVFRFHGGQRICW